MNTTQRNVLKAAAIVIALMLLFPPFARYGMHGLQYGAGFGFLFFRGELEATPNLAQLCLQWLGVLLVASAAYRLAEDKAITGLLAPAANPQSPPVAHGVEAATSADRANEEFYAQLSVEIERNSALLERLEEMENLVKFWQNEVMRRASCDPDQKQLL